MKFDAPIPNTPLDRNDGVVGQPIDRVDGRLKVTGRAVYAAEYAGQSRVAYGYVVQSAIAKGRILSLDVAAAERAPGVLLVLTYRNANPPQDQKEKTADGPTAGKKGVPQLRDDKIDHYGQPIALVVATSFEQARAAAHLVKAAYDRTPPAAEFRSLLGSAQTPKKTQKDPDSHIGDFEGAFAAAPVKIEAVYTTPYQSHAMMEPHATIAEWRGDGLTLHTSHQMISRGAGSVAATLKIPKENVRLVSRYIGGGFGGKLDVWADAILAALASRKLGGRPVKVVLTRQQIFEVTGHRPQTIQTLRLGAAPDGRLSAIGHDVVTDNNPSETFYEAAANATRTLYAGENRRTTHRLVAMDVPTGCSMRAPGEAVGLLALECAMDELAEKLKMDPIELRVRNEPSQDPESHRPYSSRTLVPCYREGAARIGWSRRAARPGAVRDGRWLVGLGMAAATRGVALQPSSASVTLNADGSVTAHMAMTDIGTGTYTIASQILAEMMGLPVSRVSVLMGDTRYPDAAGSGGSFGANSSGSALYVACEALRAQIAEAAGMESNAVRFADGAVSSGGRSVALATIGARGALTAEGEFQPGALKTAYSQQSYGAQFAEVGVDPDTGEVRMRKMVGVFTAGRILNAKTARSQCLGGMTMGIGAALTEDLQLDPRFASFVNHDLAEYHVPVHADVVDVEVVLLPELDDKASPLKSKGIGELGICGAGAAVANAVYNACGVRVRDYPLTLDKIMARLKPA